MAKQPLQKLELTWIGKGEEPKLEPRILIEYPKYSYGDPTTGKPWNYLLVPHNVVSRTITINYLIAQYER